MISTENYLIDLFDRDDAEELVLVSCPVCLKEHWADSDSFDTLPTIGQSGTMVCDDCHK